MIFHVISMTSFSLVLRVKNAENSEKEFQFQSGTNTSNGSLCAYVTSVTDRQTDRDRQNRLTDTQTGEHSLNDRFIALSVLQPL